METPNSTETKPNRFLNARVKKSTQFVGLKIEIHKLSMAQVQEIQSIAHNSGDDEGRNQAVLEYILKAGAPELEDIDDFSTFPLDELGRLATEIMVFSGLESPDSTKKVV